MYGSCCRPRVTKGSWCSFDQPWEGPFCGYCTVIQDGATYRLYYRGLPAAGRDGSAAEVCCYAESVDGTHWTKPDLGLFELAGTTHNNVVLANAAPVTHNFCPLLDTRPGVPAEQRFKALGGTMESGLVAHVSPDGIHWQRLVDPPVLTKEMVPFPYMFDSQNLAFWSESESQYLCYFRVFQEGIRRICRTTSPDFVHWSPPQLMEYRRRDWRSAHRASVYQPDASRTFARRTCTWRSPPVSCPVARCSTTPRLLRSV